MFFIALHADVSETVASYISIESLFKFAGFWSDIDVKKVQGFYIILQNNFSIFIIIRNHSQIFCFLFSVTESVQLTRAVLLVNAECYTAWNAR